MTFFERALTELSAAGATSVYGQKFTKNWCYLGVSGLPEGAQWELADRLCFPIGTDHSDKARRPFARIHVTIGEDRSE